MYESERSETEEGVQATQVGVYADMDRGWLSLALTDSLLRIATNGESCPADYELKQLRYAENLLKEMIRRATERLTRTTELDN